MEITNKSSIPFWGGVSLVAGTCIGGGMLALPVETAQAGLIPSILGLFIAWGYMLLTGLLLAEATLWVKTPHPHMVSLSYKFLGHAGRYLSIFLVLFMGLGSLVAYTTAGAPLLGKVLNFFLNGRVSAGLSICLFAGIFGAVFLCKERWVSKLNHYLVLGMIATFLVIIGIGIRSFHNISFASNFSKIPLTFPLMLTTFSYQLMVPSLVELMQRDRKSLYRAIFLGSLIPLFVYLSYEIVVFGIVPLEGEMGLYHALENGLSSTAVLYHYTRSGFLAPFVETFAFLALITSFIGYGFGMVGFLRDLFSLQATLRNLFLVALAIVLPTLSITFLIPNAFLIALDLTGGYGDTWLSGLIPIGMCWVGRHIQGIQEGSRWLMRKGILILLAMFSFFVMYVQSLKLLTG
ncbi:MAG: amino acid permease [Chlamydiia bacterium]